MTDQAFIVFLLVFNAIKEDHCPTKNSNPRQERHKHTSGTENFLAVLLSRGRRVRRFLLKVRHFDVWYEAILVSPRVNGGNF